MVDLASQIPRLLSATVLMLLAAVLLFVGPKSRAKRAFVVILVLRGLLAATYSFGLASESTDWARAWWKLFPVFLFFLPFATLYFGLVYPRPRGRLGASRATAPLFLLAGTIISTLYWIRPTLFWDLSAARGHPLGPELDAPAGPLFVFDVLPEVPFALLAFLFARDYLRAPAGAERTTPLLVSAGFAVFVLYDALTIPFFAADLVGRHAFPLQLAMAASLGAALALLVLLVGTLVWNTATSLEPAVRAHMGRYLIVLGLLVASVALLILIPADGAITTLALVRVLAVLWRLALPLVVTYALLRRHMFGIDLKVQWTIGRGAVGLIVLSIIAGTAESLINFFGNVVGLVAGGLVAALFFLALGPLQRLADRISRAAMPNVRPTQEYFAFRKLELYKAALETAMEDGDLTARERRVLATLRRNLGISEHDAQTLEGDFRRSASSFPGRARSKRGTQTR